MTLFDALRACEPWQLAVVLSALAFILWGRKWFT